MSQVIRARADLVWQEVEDQVVLLDPGTSTYHGVTGAGRILWPLLVTGTTHEDLVAELQRVFEIDAARASGDIDTFLEELTPFLDGPPTP